MEPKSKLRIVTDAKDYSKRLTDTISKPNIQKNKPINTTTNKVITKKPVSNTNSKSNIKSTELSRTIINKSTTRKPIRNTNYKPTNKRSINSNASHKQVNNRPVKTNPPTSKSILKKTRSQTTYAFIDSQNLNLGVKAQGWSLDFIKFRKFLKKELNVEKAYIFIGHVAGNQNLYIRLQEYGYILVFKPTTDHQEGDSYVTKGNVDTELVLHAMVNFDKYDKAVIITGDGDFFCLVDYLVSKKKLGKLVVPNGKYSPLFKYFTKDILNIQDIKSKVKLFRK